MQVETISNRKNFFVFECIAIIDILKDEGIITDDQFKQFYNEAENLSKMLFSMIKNIRVTRSKIPLSSTKKNQ